MFDKDNLNAVEKMMLKNVEKFMKKNKVHYVGIKLDGNGDLDFDVFYEPVKTLTQTEVTDILKLIPNNGNDDDNAGSETTTGNDPGTGVND